MTRPVPNLQAKLVDKFGYLIPPWNSFFQQLVQAAPAVASITVGVSPFLYTVNANGSLIVQGGTISNLALLRGTAIINLTGQIIIPISIGDTVRVTYSVLPTVKFLGA